MKTRHLFGFKQENSKSCVVWVQPAGDADASSQPEAAESIVVGDAMCAQWTCIWSTYIPYPHLITWKKMKYITNCFQ